MQSLPDLDRIITEYLASHARFESVFQLVEAKLGADLRVTELAEVYGATPRAFTHAFAKATGSTPEAYMSRRLNQAAVQLVIGTDLAVKEIACRLHFSDAFYFSRFFKKHNGLSPAAYRARLYSE